jgi:hypothetical protein
MGQLELKHFLEIMQIVQHLLDRQRVRAAPLPDGAIKRAEDQTVQVLLQLLGDCGSNFLCVSIMDRLGRAQATIRRSGPFDKMPCILKLPRARDHRCAGHVGARFVDPHERLDLWKRENPNAGRWHRGVIDMSLKAHENNEMPLWALSNKVVCGPIVFLGDTLDFYGHYVTSLARDYDIDAFLVSERQVGRKAPPVKARKNVEFGGEMSIVS